jgi:hypothetical protein
MNALPWLLGALLVAPLAPVTAAAQGSAVVDEGTFTVSLKGAPVGRESFRIIRAPAPRGQAYQATGTSVLGETKTTSRLGTDSAGVPVSYDSEVTTRGQKVHQLHGQGGPGRFSVLAQTTKGESAREYVLNNGALLIDEDVFIHFFFVGLAALHPEIIVISPRSAQQRKAELVARGEENVDIGGRSIPARRFSLVDAGGSRDVWLDANGRVLKIAIAAKGLLALRDDPPR